jgi:tetratricopeptide (TPR) repeat protein
MESNKSPSAGFYEFLAWVELNKQNLLIAAAVLLASALACGVYVWRKNQQETTANQALMAIRPSASSAGAPLHRAPDYLKVANQYPKTSAGAHALLLGAGDLFTQDQYQEAQNQFERFLKEYGSDPLAPKADFGVAACLDAQNKLDLALAKYQQVIAQYPISSEAGQAKLHIARLYEIKNQPKQALSLYEEMRKGNAKSAWKDEAQSRRAALLQKYPELAETNAPVTVMTNLPVAPTSSVPLKTLENKTTNVEAPGK